MLDLHLAHNDSVQVSASHTTHDDPTTPKSVQSTWQSHFFQILAEFTAKGQALKIAWQSHSI
jgi:predicted proteasome-type protease